MEKARQKRSRRSSNGAREIRDKVAGETEGKNMKTVVMMFVTFLLTNTAFAEVQSVSTITLNFDASETGALPAGFSPALTGDGGPAAWAIKEDATAPSGGKVLAQTSADATSYRFPLCVYDNVTAKDVEVSVKFKAVSGKVDQAAGIVWRYHDKDNYYIVRANAVEGNVVLYKVEKGKRADLKPLGAELLAYGRKTAVPSGQWQTLQVVAKGSRFGVFLNGEHLFDVEDNTFTAAGKVGLWTKADSVTFFDDLKIDEVRGN